MKPKHRKAQVVLAAIDPKQQKFKVLLLQTNKKRGEFWQNITGKVEDGESFDEGALRETMEETGLALEWLIEFLDLGLTHEFVDQRQRRCQERSFLVLIEHEFPVRLDPNEHQAYRWVELEALDQDSVKYPTNYESLQRARDLLRQWGS
jgi:lipoyl(octanoyl) transferase